jgi:hypothetical protein
MTDWEVEESTAGVLELLPASAVNVRPHSKQNYSYFLLRGYKFLDQWCLTRDK